MRRHGFFSPLPHAHNLSTQFNLTLALPNSLFSPLPPSPPLSCPRLHRIIFAAKYVRVCLTNIRCFFVTYVTQDGIWTASFSWELVLWPVPPPHWVDFLSASSYCCVNYTQGCWVTRQSSYRSNRCADSYPSIRDRLGQTLLSLAGPVAHWDIEK